MSRDRLPYFSFVSRTDLFAVFAAFALIFLASSTSFAGILDDKDISENIWASELAPVVDYGFSLKLKPGASSKAQPRGMSPLQTPPPGEEEMESSDPKPHKPPVLLQSTK